MSSGLGLGGCRIRAIGFSPDDLLVVEDPKKPRITET
jgi:hypothetical protein